MVDVGSTVIQYAGVFGNFVFMVAGIMIGLSFVGGGIYAILEYKKRHMFRCLILEKDGFGQQRLYWDSAGIYVDRKTNNKRFFLNKAGVGLNAENVPSISLGSDKVVVLTRDSLKNFRFIRLSVEGGSLKYGVSEEDVNWALNSYERGKKAFMSRKFMELVPYIALVVVSVTILVIFVQFFKQFGVLQDVAVAFKEAASAFAQAQSGTTVIQGG